jgi:nitrate reductase alpha subunit
MEANNQVETYVGLTAGELKMRYQQHKLDFNNIADNSATTLSSHIWNLKDQNTPYKIRFEIVGRAAPYSAVTGRCNLCTSENMKFIHPRESNLKFEK